jgi:hypothetical protein
MAVASMSEVMRLELTRFWTNPSLVVALFAQACLICGGACLIIFVVLQSFTQGLSFFFLFRGQMVSIF